MSTQPVNDVSSAKSAHETASMVFLMDSSPVVAEWVLPTVPDPDQNFRVLIHRL
jgi:hypothetical protein